MSCVPTTHKVLYCYDAWADQSFQIPLEGPDKGLLFKLIDQYSEPCWYPLRRATDADYEEMKKRNAKPIVVKRCR